MRPVDNASPERELESQRVRLTCTGMTEQDRDQIAAAWIVASVVVIGLAIVAPFLGGAGVHDGAWVDPGRPRFEAGLPKPPGRLIEADLPLFEFDEPFAAPPDNDEAPSPILTIAPAAPRKGSYSC
ncbi:MAG: hypothetical protein HY057_11700 [Rhodospirillales bacterium]|nr:hypothetical protein [Rhodospirillales bacterium]